MDEMSPAKIALSDADLTQFDEGPFSEPPGDVLEYGEVAESEKSESIQTLVDVVPSDEDISSSQELLIEEAPHVAPEVEIVEAETAPEVPAEENDLIEIQENGTTTISFPIREGVKFHNGEVLTAEDVTYTFKRGLLAGAQTSNYNMLAQNLLGAASFKDLVDEIGFDAAYEQLEQRIGYMLKTTTQLSATQTRGTSSTSSTVIFGNWKQFYTAQWRGLEIKVSDTANIGGNSAMSRDFIWVVAFMEVDSNVGRVTAFTIVEDAETAEANWTNG